MPKLSFVIPVYNVEKYIGECVESIINQEYSDFEVILVDDGSTDRSGEICDEYALKDERIIVIHKENGGLSDARNVGTAKAVGEYICYIDSDDLIENNSLLPIMEKAEEQMPDVMFLEIVKFFSDDGTVSPMSNGFDVDMFDGQEQAKVLDNIASLPKFPASACTKLIKKSVLTENDIYFEKNLLSEDWDFSLALFIASNKFSYINVPFYRYRQNREGSITNTVGDKNVESQLYIMEKWTDNCDDEYKDFICSCLSYLYTVSLSYIGFTSKCNRNSFVKRYKKLKYLLDYAKCSKAKLARIMVKLLGIRGASYALGLYLKWR